MISPPGPGEVNVGEISISILAVHGCRTHSYLSNNVALITDNMVNIYEKLFQ